MGYKTESQCLQRPYEDAVNVKFEADYLQCWKLLRFPLPNARRLEVLNTLDIYGHVTLIYLGDKFTKLTPIRHQYFDPPLEVGKPKDTFNAT